MRSDTLPRVLIVDDMPLNLEVLRMTLEDSYTATTADNGEAALEQALAPQQPDLILLDIMMPDMDGYEVCRRLKADKRTAHIPIIFITAMSGEADEVKGLELGAVDYLAKPLSLPVVRARVATHLALAQARSKNRIYAKAFEHATSGLLITDAENVILEVNPAFERITGYSSSEVVGKTPSILKSGIQSEEFYQMMWLALSEHGYWSGDLWNRRKSGETYPEKLGINAIFDEAGHLTHYLAVLSDITEEKEREMKLLQKATHDPLTGLPNRDLLQDRLKQIIARAAREESVVVTLFIDLDRFKPVNDTHGHETGDALLKEVSQRMLRDLRSSDTIARFGGDEFVVISTVRNSADAETVAAKLLERIIQPYTINGLKLEIGCSIGIETCKPGSCNSENLLKGADEAMYRAKKEGRNRYCFND